MTCGTLSARAGSTSCHGRASVLRRMAGQWHPLPPLGPAVHGQRRTRTCDPRAPPIARIGSATASWIIRRSSAGSTPRASPRRRTRPAPSATPAAIFSEGPGQFNIDASLIKNTRIGRLNTEIRIEAFNVLNHPQFAQPVTTSATSSGRAFGQITAMLSNASCSFCGTTERQVQIGVKMRF